MLAPDKEILMEWAVLMYTKGIGFFKFYELFFLPYIHSPLVADHFSVNSLPPTAAANGFIRKTFIVFSTVL